MAGPASSGSKVLGSPTLSPTPVSDSSDVSRLWPDPTAAPASTALSSCVSSTAPPSGRSLSSGSLIRQGYDTGLGMREHSCRSRHADQRKRACGSKPRPRPLHLLCIDPASVNTVAQLVAELGLATRVRRRGLTRRAGRTTARDHVRGQNVAPVVALSYRLTDRESQVAMQCIQGCATEEIARRSAGTRRCRRLATATVPCDFQVYRICAPRFRAAPSTSSVIRWMESSPSSAK